jgi:hypothetical protein
VQNAADMGYYEPQERRTEQVTCRVPKALKESLTDLAKLWTEMERSRLEGADVEVSLADVVVRLLTLGSEGAWTEVGGRPETQEQWKALLKSATKNIVNR